jgi:hypothetical protein
MDFFPVSIKKLKNRPKTRSFESVNFRNSHLWYKRDTSFKRKNPMQFLEQLKTSNPALRVRRNHAMEHATLQILAEKRHPHGLGGLSDTRGFWVFGEIDPETLMQAAEEARKRLNKGEHHLAIHPHCGTNFAAAGIVGGFFAWLAMLGVKKNWNDLVDRLANLITLVTLGMIVAQPLGPKLQKAVTTEANLGDLKVVEVKRMNDQGMPTHRVLTVS